MPFLHLRWLLSTIVHNTGGGGGGVAALTKLQIPGPHLEILICRNEVGLNNFFIFFLLGALQGLFP